MTTTRSDILDAAVKIALLEGVKAVTVQSVARAVRLTKAGLLHHYPSKNALLAAMLEHIGQKLAASVEVEAARDPRPEGRWIRSLLRVAMHASGDAAPTDAVRAFKVMLTVSANNPELMKPVQAQVRAMLQRVLAQPDGERELIAWLTVDGVLLWQHLGILDPDDPIATKILRTLLGSFEIRPERGGRSASAKPRKRAARK